MNEIFGTITHFGSSYQVSVLLPGRRYPESFGKAYTEEYIKTAMQKAEKAYPDIQWITPYRMAKYSSAF